MKHSICFVPTLFDDKFLCCITPKWPHAYKWYQDPLSWKINAVSLIPHLSLKQSIENHYQYHSECLKQLDQENLTTSSWHERSCISKFQTVKQIIPKAKGWFHQTSISLQKHQNLDLKNSKSHFLHETSISNSTPTYLNLLAKKTVIQKI